MLPVGLLLASSVNLVFSYDSLIVCRFFLLVSSLLFDTSPTRFGGAVAKLRQYDEFAVIMWHSHTGDAGMIL